MGMDNDFPTTVAESFRQAMLADPIVLLPDVFIGRKVTQMKSPSGEPVQGDPIFTTFATRLSTIGGGLCDGEIIHWTVAGHEQPIRQKVNKENIANFNRFMDSCTVLGSEAMLSEAGHG